MRSALAPSGWRCRCYRVPFVVACLLVSSLDSLVSATATSSDAQTTCRGGSSSTTPSEQAVVNDVARSLSEQDTTDPLAFPFDVKKASNEFSSSKGNRAWKFLSGLALSPTFRNEYWHKKPLLLRAANTGDWIQDSFTVEHDLRLVGGSYISGHCTAEILRNGTSTDTWEFRPIKDNPARKTTWEEVEQALQGGTIYFNTAGSLWPTLGALCRLTIGAFGVPANVNVYLTPPGVTTSVPPHTDRQDVLVLQTMGAKRWRVFAPPTRVQGGMDPLHRGKSGDVLSLDELGTPLIDAVVKKGDVLYVPTGFPHTTDTITGEEGVFDETSVHLTMGLDSNVWGLTFAHLRWSLLQRMGQDFRLSIEDDDAYWASMETIPIGFLGSDEWKECMVSLRQGNGMTENFRTEVMDRFKSVLQQLEPNRWNNELPSDEEIGKVVDYIVGEHLQELMEIQSKMFSDVNPHDEASLVKAFECTQQQNALMEKFGAFSKNEAMRSSFAQRRLEQDEKLNRN